MIYTITDHNGNQCNSSLPFCGYSYETLKDMESNGYILQIAGKKSKFPTKAEWAETTTAAKKTR